MEQYQKIIVVCLLIYISFVILIKFINKKIEIIKLIIISILFLILISIISIMVLRHIHRDEPYQGLIYLFYFLEANIYYLIACTIFIILCKVFKK